MNIINTSFPATRKRRNRQADFSRQLIRENHLSASDLVLPVFITEGNNVRESLASMPGLFRLSIDELIKEIDELRALGIIAINLYPQIDQTLKSLDAAYAHDSQGLVPRAIRAVKKAFPDFGIFSDVALDPYTVHGQDGIIDANAYVDNDLTLQALAEQALCHAAAGVDYVAPSDMMDGRTARIRAVLEENGFANTGIMAYTKYASAFYDPFRSAIGSAANLGKADKNTYQMDPANGAEALHEIAIDIAEGADMIMVKPGMVYLDILQRAKERFQFPTAVYQTSGEYVMLEAACTNGFMKRDRIIIESLLAFKRAGADMIFTYFAKPAAQLLREA